MLISQFTVSKCRPGNWFWNSASSSSYSFLTRTRHLKLLNTQRCFKLNVCVWMEAAGALQAAGSTLNEICLLHLTQLLWKQTLCITVFSAVSLLVNQQRLLCLSPTEALLVDPWFLSVVSHVDVHSSCHLPAAEPAQVSGPRSHAGSLSNRTRSEPGKSTLGAETTHRVACAPSTVL